MSDTEAQEAVRHALATLAEHFECVMILATRIEEEATQTVIMSEGNYNTRYGMVKRWLDEEI